MKKLYLIEMGMQDNNITGDIKNHRVRVTENIDIIFNGKKYNMFFEFTEGDRRTWRDTNKRTGAPLKKPVIDSVQHNALWIDTQFEQEETNSNGHKFMMSYRQCNLEKEIHDNKPSFTRKDVLEIVNRYSIEKYSKVVLIEEEARRIINTCGGYREKAILADGIDFQTDGDSYMERRQWDEAHKIVRVNRRQWEKTEDGRRLVITDFCEVDLETGKITN